MSTDVKDLQTRKPQNFPDMLKASLSQIGNALPRHLNPDRMSRIALTAFRRTPALQKCDPRSVIAAVIQASQLGLEPDTLGRAYLIPYKRECQFIPGWKGLVELVNRSGQGSVWTGAVFQGDEFEYSLGSNPHIEHKPKGEYDPRLLQYVYAVGMAKGAEYPVLEIWPIERVIKHRDRYNKVGKSHYSFDNLEMYARKVVLLQVLKYMPMSPELVTAVELDQAATTGEQKLNVEDAIEGTWEPVPEPEAESTATAEETTATAAPKKKASKKKTVKKAAAKPDPEAPAANEQTDAAKEFFGDDDGFGGLE